MTNDQTCNNLWRIHRVPRYQPQRHLVDEIIDISSEKEVFQRAAAFLKFNDMVFEGGRQIVREANFTCTRRQAMSADKGKIMRPHKRLKPLSFKRISRLLDGMTAEATTYFSMMVAGGDNRHQ